MIAESLKDELKIAYLELNEIKFNPDLEKFRGIIGPLSMSVKMDISRDIYNDLLTKEDYESLTVFVEFSIADDKTKEFLAKVSTITTYEIRALKLAEITPDFYIYLHSVGIEHCAGWFANKAIGTALESYCIHHLGPEQYGSDIQKKINNTWA